MATEKATLTTATQNPAPSSPTAPTKASKARATRAKTSNTTAEVSGVAPAKARARTKKSQAASVVQAETAAEAVAVEQALLQHEAAKSLSVVAAGIAPPKATKAHCGQCGREMRFVPFTLSNLMCRSCYGLDRYRRPAAPSLSSLTAPRPSGPR